MPSQGSFLGRVGDKIAWGNNIGANGQFHATPGQVIGGIGSRALNFVIPGAGTVVNAIGNGYNGSGLLSKVFDFFRGGGKPGEVTHSQFGTDNPGVDVNNVGVQVPGIGNPMGGSSGWVGPQPGGGYGAFQPSAGFNPGGYSSPYTNPTGGGSFLNGDFGAPAGPPAGDWGAFQPNAGNGGGQGSGGSSMGGYGGSGMYGNAVTGSVSGQAARDAAAGLRGIFNGGDGASPYAHLRLT